MSSENMKQFKDIIDSLGETELMYAPAMLMRVSLPDPKEEAVQYTIEHLSEISGAGEYKNTEHLFRAVLLDLHDNPENSTAWGRVLLAQNPQACVQMAGEPLLVKTLKRRIDHSQDTGAQFLGDFWRVALDAISNNPGSYTQKNYIDFLELAYLKSNRSMVVKLDDIETLRNLEKVRWFEDPQDSSVPLIESDIKRTLLKHIGYETAGAHTPNPTKKAPKL